MLVFFQGCNHDWRLCRYTVIIEGAMLSEKGRINVVLVGEELGIQEGAGIIMF